MKTKELKTKQTEVTGYCHIEKRLAKFTTCTDDKKMFACCTCSYRTSNLQVMEQIKTLQSLK